MKKGIIDTSALSTLPEKHEYKTAKFFADYGHDVRFIKPSNIQGQKSPDFKMDGRDWETKSPIKFSESSFEDNFKKAIKQSKHIVYDLRRLNIKDEKKYIKSLEKRKKIQEIKTLLIITKDGNLLTKKGNFGKIKI